MRKPSIPSAPGNGEATITLANPAVAELVLGHSPSVHFGLNERAEWIYLSARWQQWTGQSPASACGQPALEWFDEADRPALERYLAQLQRFGLGLVPAPVRLTTGAAEPLWVELHAERSPDTSIAAVVGSIVDVSAHHESAERLGRALREAELVAQTSGDESWHWSVTTDRMLLPARYRVNSTVVGRQAGLEFRTFLESVDPRDRSDLSDALVAHLTLGKPFRHEFRAQRKPGKQLTWWAMRGQATWSSTGRALTMGGSMRDLTRERQAQQLNNCLAHILESTTDIVFTFDSLGHLHFINAAGYNSLALSQSEAPGRATAPFDIAEFLDDASNQLLRDTVLPQVFRDGVWRGDLNLRPRDRTTPIPISTVVLLHSDDDGGPMLSAIARDMSGDARTMQLLRAAHRHALAQSHSISQLLCAVGNEFVPRLRQVFEDVDTLSGGELTAAQQGPLDTLRGAVEALSEVFSVASDFVLLQTNSLRLLSAPVDLVSILDDLVSEAGEAVRARQIDLILDVMPQAPRRGLGDGARIRQVLHSVLQAAIARTARGQVSVALEKASARSPRSRARIVVEDTGEALEPDVLERLFTFSGEAAAAASADSSGLGLALSRGLARAMGGDLVLRSDPGAGTTAVIEFELPPDAEGELDGASEVALPGRTAYIFDPNPNAGLALLRALEVREIACFCAESEAGLEDFLDSSAGNGRSPDLLIAPLASEAVIREGLSKLKTAPAVILTASEQAGAQPGNHAPFQVLLKPMTWGGLDRALAQLHWPEKPVRPRVRPISERREAEPGGPAAAGLG